MQQGYPLTYRDTSLPVETRVTHLLRQMSLAEKIGQITQIEINSLRPSDVTTYFLGSVLSGGGVHPPINDVYHWGQMVRGFQEAALETRLGIPLMYGVDAVHGHGNMEGAVVFPHNIGLGATRDADLVERIGRVTAQELLACGIHWNFAPAVSVPQDIRWGRTYEGYGENTTLVTNLGVAYVRGLQNVNGNLPLSHPHTVLASIKHFVGDGGTAWGSRRHLEWLPFIWTGEGTTWRIDQGETRVSEEVLRAVHLPPYEAAIEIGAMNIMVSYSSWDGTKMHAQRYLLTDVLKGELGFEGFLVSDWLGINQIAEDYYTCVVESINAGLDMIMVPYDGPGFIAALTHAVENGDVSIERIDDAVRRILRAKFMLGLFENPFGDESLQAEVGSPAHRELAREAVRKSAVLLKNERRALPLDRDLASIFVAGRAADDVGLQCGGWTIAWMGAEGPITPGTTILEGIRAAAPPSTPIDYRADGDFEGSGRADVAIVVVGETPYAEGQGDRGDLSLSADDAALIERVRPHCRVLVLVIVSGRPLIITAQEPHCEAIVAAWLPGTEGQGLADVLFGDYPFTGKLPHAWPRSMDQVPRSKLHGREHDALWPYGHGL